MNLWTVAMRSPGGREALSASGAQPPDHPIDPDRSDVRDSPIPQKSGGRKRDRANPGYPNIQDLYSRG